MRLRHKLDYVRQYLAYLISYTLNYPLCYPKEINFQMTNRCPLSCRMCRISRLPARTEELEVSEMKEVLHQVSGWGTRYVSFVGGEALVRLDDTIELIRHASQLGFHTTLFSGGGYSLARKTCERLLNAGLNRFTISLDGATASTHDFVRGKGTFHRALNTLSRIMGLADGYEIKFDLATVIMSYNFRELVDIYWLAKQIGVDQIFFQAVVPDNTYMADESVYEEVDFWIGGESLAELRQIIKELVWLKSRDRNFIFNSITYLRSIPRYFELKGRFNPGRCLAGYMGLNIDPYGNISICGLGPDLNVRGANLSELWKSVQFRRVRSAIKRCRIPCMMLCYGKFETKELLRYLLEGWS